MGLATTIALRTLCQKPGRTFFSVAGIAVGIATVVGIFTLDHNTLLGRTRGAEPEWEAEIEVRPSRRVEDPRRELEQMPGILGVTAAFQKNAVVRPEGDRTKRTGVQLVALEPESAASLEAIQLLEGAPLDAVGRRGEVLVGHELAEEHGLGVGARLELAKPGRAARSATSRECVDGEWVETEREARPERAPLHWRDFTVVGVLANEGLGRKGRGEVVVVSYVDGLELFDGAHVATRYWLRRDPGVNIERLQADLGEAWSYDLKKSVIIGQAADERAFRNGVRFAGLLALVLGLFVIFHTLSMSLVERVREVGMLHALGTTRRQIARVFLLEAGIIAGLGGLAGFAGGLGMAFVLLRKGITTVGVGRQVRVFEVPWGVCLPLTLAGVAIALVGSIFPLVRARNTDAVSALRGVDPKEGGGAKHGTGRAFQLLAVLLLALILPAIYFFVVPVVGEADRELVGVLMLGVGILALFIAVPLLAPTLLAFVCVRLAGTLERFFPLAGKLSARSMTDAPARVAGAAAGIALVAAGFVGLRVMTNSLVGEIDVWSQEAFLDKVYVSELPETDLAALTGHLKSYPGVLGVEPNQARTYAPFLVIGVDEDELAAWGPCSEDPGLVRALREERGIILSRRIAKHREYELGDLVHIEAADGDVESFPVVAISDAYGYFPHPDERLYGVISDHWMKQMFCMDVGVTSEVAVRMDPGFSSREQDVVIRTAIGELFPQAEPRIETGRWLQSFHSRDIARDFVLFDIIILLTVLLAGLGVLNGQLLSALERAKELGVLKALGTTRRQVAGMILLESGVVGLIGGALGVTLGAVLGPFIVGALEVISGLELPRRGAGLHVVGALVGAVVVALAAGLYPIWRMNRADAIAAVRTGG